MAFAALTEPDEITVEGRVGATQAWSTSKVLIVAAFLDGVAGGDPDAITARNRQLITKALTASDGEAVNALRDQIPGRPGPAMTRVLRAIGDRTTSPPDTYQGLMRWSILEQVRFMAAMAHGRVVSRAASSFLRKAMRPIPAHAWGLGRIGASAYKGGWLRADTATRQLGLVDGYAVAIITTAGPARRQTDGDSAHVQAMDRLAALLAERLAFERSR
ncbi:serine hydrolase [Microlunatus ginsengisoli]|uniref:Serine hydrolase n=1 Tax=Microlunatus ginsengisoli TaxID=363863 RepID=A0ABP6ZR72_9ACTN